MFSLPSVHTLVASVSYCVMRDPVLHESIVFSGRTIQEGAETSRDFRHYPIEAPIPIDYVRVLCGDFSIAIWRDPSRPELNIAREPEPVTVLLRRGDPEVLAKEDWMADDALSAELSEADLKEEAEDRGSFRYLPGLANKLAAGYTPLEFELRTAAHRFVQSITLYVQ